MKFFVCSFGSKFNDSTNCLLCNICYLNTIENQVVKDQYNCDRNTTVIRWYFNRKLLKY